MMPLDANTDSPGTTCSSDWAFFLAGGIYDQPFGQCYGHCAISNFTSRRRPDVIAATAGPRSARAQLGGELLAGTVRGVVRVGLCCGTAAAEHRHETRDQLRIQTRHPKFKGPLHTPRGRWRRVTWQKTARTTKKRYHKVGGAGEGRKKAEKWWECHTFPYNTAGPTTNVRI